MLHILLSKNQAVSLTIRVDTSKMNLNLKVIQLPRIQMHKMPVKPVAVNGMMKLILVQDQTTKKDKLVKPMVVHGILKQVHVLKKTPKQMMLKQLVQTMVVLGMVVLVHIQLLNLNLNQLQHQTHLLLKQQDIFGMMEEVYTTYLIGYNAECSNEHSFYLKKTHLIN